MGPAESFTSATTEPCSHLTNNKWLYRVLRRGEKPVSLRQPKDFGCSKDDELRALLLDSCAYGNDPANPSCFLHATMRLGNAWRIRNERAHLYSNWLVRFPMEMDGVTVIDLTSYSSAGKYLNDAKGDSAYLRQCLQVVRGYADKDQEAVLLQRPPLELIEWWSEADGRWRPAQDLLEAQRDPQRSAAEQAAPPAPGASSKSPAPRQAASSQAQARVGI